jgi:hypothetical protein
MRKALYHRYTVTTAHTGFVDLQDSDKNYCSMDEYDAGTIMIAAAEAGAATLLTFYATNWNDTTMVPLYKADGSTAVTAAIPAGAQANGATVPLPTECLGAFRIAAKADAACTISIFRKSA